VKVKTNKIRFTMEDLAAVGLTGYKAKAYKALCEYGTCTASDIVRASGVPQCKVYAIMAELEYDDLVEECAGGSKAWKALPMTTAIDKQIKSLQDIRKVFE
jgi:sugar-specific transcriptional regulator TrmB